MRPCQEIHRLHPRVIETRAMNNWNEDGRACRFLFIFVFFFHKHTYCILAPFQRKEKEDSSTECLTHPAQRHDHTRCANAREISWGIEEIYLNNSRETYGKRGAPCALVH